MYTEPEIVWLEYLRLLRWLKQIPYSFANGFWLDRLVSCFFRWRDLSG